MNILDTTIQVKKPSLFVLALCWTKAFYISAKQRWMLARIFYLKH
ncbi:MAG: hypothetical protein R3E13_10375 [Alphaproteobacteria bacterium]